MDPLSIAASACGIAALCGTLLSSVGRFVNDANDAPDAVKEFRTTIETLRTVLESIEGTIQSRKELPFALRQEQKHWQDIGHVLDASRNSLYRLGKKLPQVKTDNPSMLQQAKIQVRMVLKSNVVVQNVAHINSYTTVLQLSLTTVSLGDIWETRRGQDQLKQEIQKLTAEIRSSATLFQNAQVLGLCASQSPNLNEDPDEDITLSEIRANQTLGAWRESAEQLAMAVTLYEPDDQSIRERAEGLTRAERTMNWSRQNSMPVEALEASEAGEPWQMLSSVKSNGRHDPDDDDADSDFEPEPGKVDMLSIDQIQCQISANRENVKRLLDSGIFTLAEQFQRSGIELREQLSKIDQTPFHDKHEAEEMLADILMKQDTKDGYNKAKDKLKQLIEEEVQRGSDGGTKVRLLTLYYKLSQSYLKLGKLKDAKKFATRALTGRQKISPWPKDQVKESTVLLITICQENGDFDEARGLSIWMEQNFPDDISSPKPVQEQSTEEESGPIADAILWCKNHGFDIEKHGYRVFDQINADGKTPLHIAIAEDERKIVPQIVDHVASLEVRDLDQCTPLLIACSTRNRKITELLLTKGCNTGVYDRDKNTPLHRAQFAEGGTSVVRQILDHPSHACPIDAKNSYDQTALHLACQYGNEAMVDLLLQRKADVNAAGPAECTPLHIAIEYRRLSIVNKLLDRGADINLRDGLNRDALRAAEMANHPSPDIQDVLKEWKINGKVRRPSNVSSFMGRRDTVFSHASTNSSGSEGLGGGGVKRSPTWTRSIFGLGIVRKDSRDVEHVEDV